MPTTTSCIDRSAAAIMLLEAMVRESKRQDLAKKFNIPEGANGQVSVCLTINGVEVDFLKTIEEMWNRMESRFEADVSEKAKELISLTRFDNLQEKLSQLEWEVQNEVEKLLEKKHV